MKASKEGGKEGGKELAAAWERARKVGKWSRFARGCRDGLASLEAVEMVSLRSRL
jgi:hypothetical protein